MAVWPEVWTIKDWARVPDMADDDAIRAALAAVRAAVLARCPILVDVTDPNVPDDVAAAIVMWTTRLLARRNSPDGTIGTPEFGVANVPRWDPDVQRLLSPWTEAVIA